MIFAASYLELKATGTLKSLVKLLKGGGGWGDCEQIPRYISPIITKPFSIVKNEFGTYVYSFHSTMHFKLKYSDEDYLA
jgi:hypothetical protein